MATAQKTVMGAYVRERNTLDRLHTAQRQAACAARRLARAEAAHARAVALLDARA